jgi:chromosome segregation ATPase
VNTHHIESTVEHMTRLKQEFTALQVEFEAVRAHRVQADALCGELRDNLKATAVERDNAIKDAKTHYGALMDARAELRRVHLERDALRSDLSRANHRANIPSSKGR